MLIAPLFFYLFATITVVSALIVIGSRNPVHSVLFLILAFVNASGLFLLMGAEFLAMVLVVVYVGAVAVLFLFVVMMLDVDFAELRQGFQQYLPIGAVVGGIILFELILILGSYQIAPESLSRAAQLGAPAAKNLPNTEALGQVIYTQFFYVFQASGLILLVAMIGAIVLTLRHRTGIKRQNVAAQVARNPATSIEIKKDVVSGKGLGNV